MPTKCFYSSIIIKCASKVVTSYHSEDRTNFFVGYVSNLFSFFRIFLDFGHPKNITDLLALAADKRDAKQKKTLKDYYNKQDAQLPNLTKAVADSKKPRPIDPKLKEYQDVLGRAQAPLLIDPKLSTLKRAVGLSTKQLPNKRLIGAQDIAWALINSPAFLFNH